MINPINTKQLSHVYIYEMSTIDKEEGVYQFFR